jgi:hypothetical protein
MSTSTVETFQDAMDRLRVSVDLGPTAVTVFPAPVWETSDGDFTHCSECGRRITRACYDGADGMYCAKCMDQIIADVTAEARRYAARRCKLTSRLRMRDIRNIDYCLRTCTNYDRLIRHWTQEGTLERMDTDNVYNNILYHAIRARFNELLLFAFERLESEGPARRRRHGAKRTV